MVDRALVTVMNVVWPSTVAHTHAVWGFPTSMCSHTGDRRRSDRWIEVSPGYSASTTRARCSQMFPMGRKEKHDSSGLTPLFHAIDILGARIWRSIIIVTTCLFTDIACSPAHTP